MYRRSLLPKTTTDNVMIINNHNVAQAFFEMAELLAIQGGEPHRVRAFQNAGQILDHLPEPVSRMVKYGTLKQIPGIGDGTLHRVKQILRRGTCDDLVRLQSSLPAGLRELIKVKGLGPSTVRHLHQRLRISSVEQLEAVILSGQIYRLPRFSVDRAHKLLQEIAVYKGRRGKVPLVEALATAESIAAELREVAGTLDVIFGGSLRRHKPMIGDLDILACADDPAPLIERFSHLPQSTSILRRVDGGSIRLATGQQADLWVFPPQCWGAGLHAFSGTKEHVVALRTRAGRMGMHISEHGVFTRDRRLITSGREEVEIFQAVGLPFIPPVMRQNLGEIELAEQGRLPQVVTAEDLRGDLHLHTRESDGKNTAREMALAAFDLGYEYLAVTDHSKNLSVANGLDAARLAQQIEQLRRLEQDLGRIHILAGIEVDIMADGSLDLEPSILRQLDWVVASIHERFDLDGEAMTERIIRAMESGLVDAIGHPTGRKLGKRDPYEVDMARLFETARRLGVALEINGGPYRMDLDETHCRQAKEMGVPLVINTDAHSTRQLGIRDYALAAAQRGWVEAKHVLNSGSIDAIRDFRQQRLRRSGIVVPVRQGLQLTQDEAEAAPKAETEPEVDTKLLRTLGEPLDDALRQRLQSYLQSGEDAELETALLQLSSNPVQQAFNLLMGAPPA